MDRRREPDEVPIRHFTDLEVWRKSHQLFLDLLREIEQLPHNRAATIFTDQLLRSIGSIGANIAEGFNCSQAKFVNSLSIALQGDLLFHNGESLRIGVPRWFR